MGKLNIIVKTSSKMCQTFQMQFSRNMGYATPKTAFQPEQAYQPELDVTALRMSTVPIVWVLGGPGSGKGTQCEKIVGKYGFTHLSTGDLLRDVVKSGTSKGQQLKDIMAKGDLVPMNVMLDLLKVAMVTKLGDSQGYLIDGYPREVQQGEEFENQIKECNMILYFDVADETLMSRLLKRAETSGRSDDNERIIRKRLDLFHSHSKPVVDRFGDKVKMIMAETDPQTVFSEVCKQLDIM